MGFRGALRGLYGEVWGIGVSRLGVEVGIGGASNHTSYLSWGEAIRKHARHAIQISEAFRKDLPLAGYRSGSHSLLLRDL